MIIKLKSRPLIQDNMNNLLEYIGNNNISNANDLLNKLESNIVKYCISRGRSPDDFHAKLNDIRYSLTHGGVLTSFAMKQQWIYAEINKLVTLLVDDDKNMSLKDKLEQSASDIREDFDNFCSTGYIEDMDVIFDDFKVLRKLSKDISLLGSKIYKSYSQVMKYSGECSGLLPKMMPLNKKARDRKAMWKPGESALNSITSSFGSLYSALEDLIALIDAPLDDEESEEKKEKKDIDSDIDEQQRDALRSEALRLLTEEDKSLQKIAPLLGITMDELLDLLDITG